MVVETFLLKATNVHLIVELEAKPRDQQGQWDSSSGNHECLYKTLCQSINEIDVEIFSWISENFEGLVVVDELIHSLGTMNVCKKFHGNQFYS